MKHIKLFENFKINEGFWDFDSLKGTNNVSDEIAKNSPFKRGDVVKVKETSGNCEIEEIFQKPDKTYLYGILVKDSIYKGSKRCRRE